MFPSAVQTISMSVKRIYLIEYVRTAVTCEKVFSENGKHIADWRVMFIFKS